MSCVYGHMYVCRAFVRMYVSRAFVHDVCVTFGVYIGFGGLIDGYSALGVVYEVAFEVVMTTHAGCAGDAGIAIWRARLFAAHLRVRA